MNGTILVVDDEPQIARLAQDYLVRDGFRVVVAGDGATALAQARHDPPDLVVLDLNLPGMDGLEVCRALRRTSDVPVIMLTARAEEADRLIGLELGADDYIVKPFSPRELVARVRAVLRRARGAVREPAVIRAGALEIDIESHAVRRGGADLALTRSEFNLLAILAQNPGQVFTREQLIERIHGVAYDGVDRSVDSHIKNLRRKIEVDPLAPQYVLTVYGVGYRFAGPCRCWRGGRVKGRPVSDRRWRDRGDGDWQAWRHQWRGDRRRHRRLFWRFVGGLALSLGIFLLWTASLARVVGHLSGLGDAGSVASWLAALSATILLPVGIIVLLRYGFARLIVPLSDLVHAADAVAAGDLSVRVARRAGAAWVAWPGRSTT